jgi:ribosomal-protein-alanine N-acetyltransferase
VIAAVGAEAAPWLAGLHAASMPHMPWDEPAFRDLLAMPGAFALACAQGFVLARIAADEAEIVTLAVHPRARRQGHGSALLQAALAAARRAGAARMFLEVAADNAAALSLYRRAGFGELGRRARYYGDTDALVLGITISS